MKLPKLLAPTNLGQLHVLFLGRSLLVPSISYSPLLAAILCSLSTWNSSFYQGSRASFWHALSLEIFHSDRLLIFQWNVDPDPCFKIIILVLFCLSVAEMSANQVVAMFLSLILLDKFHRMVTVFLRVILQTCLSSITQIHQYPSKHGKSLGFEMWTV